MQKELKKAYLYSRVSTDTQAEHGQGIERQLEAARKFLSQYPEYEFDVSTTITDAGVSAYSGDNITDSAGLGGFLAAVRSGQVKRGSLLVIEAPDRLTRLGIRKGQRLFDELADHGIDVGLVRFGVIVKHDLENDFTSSLIISIGLYLGHLESKQKSERIQASMRKRQDEQRAGELVKAIKTPRWCEQTDEGYSVNAFGEVVKQMFQLRIEGFGAAKIAERLTAQGLEDITPQYVHRCLKNRAVIGEFQPISTVKEDGTKRAERVPVGEPIRDHYPKVVDEFTFQEVQLLIEGNSGSKGNKTQFRNLFRGLSKCPNCGKPTKTVVQNGGKYTYYRCISKTEKSLVSCGMSGVNRDKTLNYVVPALRKFNYNKLAYTLPTVTQDSGLFQKEIDEILATIENDRAALNVLTGGSRSLVEGEIRANEQKVYNLRKKQAENATVARTGVDIDKHQEAIRNNPLETVGDRIKFNQNIKQFIEYVQFDKKTWTVKFKESDLVVTIAYSEKDISGLMTNFYKHQKQLAEGNITAQELSELLDAPVKEVG